MNKLPVGLLLLVAALGAAAGFYAYRAVGPRATGPVPASAGATTTGTATGGAALPAGGATSAAAPGASAPGAGPATGEETPPATPIPAEVPEMSLPDMKGKLHALRDSGGHARLFNFWATWCEPCRREIPLLNGLQQQYSDEGLQVVGIAVDERAAVQQFLKTTPMSYTLLVGEDGGYEAAQKFGMALALPFSVFADADNHVIAVKLGELHGDDAAAILANMRALRAGTTTIEAARSNIAEALKTLAMERSKQSTGK